MAKVVKRQNLIVTLLAVVIFLTLGTIIGRLSTNITLSSVRPISQIKSVKELQFINRQDGYQFNYPSTWLKLSPAGLRKISQGVSGALLHRQPQALITIRVTTVKKGGSLESLPEELDKRMAQEFSSFQKQSEQFVTVGQERALRYSYSFKTKNNKEVFQSQQILLKRDKAYYLLLHTTLEDFQKLQPDWEQIASSFRLK